MLTFLLGCVTITFVGCENGKKEVNGFIFGEIYDFILSAEKEEKIRRDFKRPGK